MSLEVVDVGVNMNSHVGNEAEACKGHDALDLDRGTWDCERLLIVFVHSFITPEASHINILHNVLQMQ